MLRQLVSSQRLFEIEFLRNVLAKSNFVSHGRIRICQVVTLIRVLFLGVVNLESLLIVR